MRLAGTTSLPAITRQAIGAAEPTLEADERGQVKKRFV
jgi:hypothetical protein